MSFCACFIRMCSTLDMLLTIVFEMKGYLILDLRLELNDTGSITMVDLIMLIF
jgi:hypothetical protein